MKRLSLLVLAALVLGGLVVLALPRRERAAVSGDAMAHAG